MGYYGIADFANDFNRAQDDSLMSGVRAANAMRESYLANYRVPEQMTGSDVNALDNSIKYDTLDNAYGDIVQTGLNKARTDNMLGQSGMQKVWADQSINKLKAEAAQRGLTNPMDVADYISSNLPPEQVAANPYLQNAATDYRRIAGQTTLNLGSALGGNVGTGMMTSGMGALGYGNLSATTDDNGNIVYRDASTGAQSTPLSMGAQIPSAAAFGGNVDPLANYNVNLEGRQFENARYNAANQAREYAAQLRYGQYGQGGYGNTRAMQAQLSSLQRLYTSQKGNPVEQAKTLQRINQLLGEMGGAGGGMSAGGGGTLGMSAIAGGSPPAGGSAAPVVGNAASNPFTPNAAAPTPTPAAPAAPVSAPALPAAYAPPAQSAAPAQPNAAAAPASALDPQTAYSDAQSDAQSANSNLTMIQGVMDDFQKQNPMGMFGPIDPSRNDLYQTIKARLAAAQAAADSAQGRVGQAHAAMLGYQRDQDHQAYLAQRAQSQTQAAKELDAMIAARAKK